jgi:hypothetical protein
MSSKLRRSDRRSVNATTTATAAATATPTIDDTGSSSSSSSSSNNNNKNKYNNNIKDDHDFPDSVAAAPQRKGKRKSTDSPSTRTEVAADIDNNKLICFALDTGDATAIEEDMVEVALEKRKPAYPTEVIYFELDTGGATVMDGSLVEVAFDRNEDIRIDAIKEAVLQKFSKATLKDMDTNNLQVYSGRNKKVKLGGLATWDVKLDGGDSSNPLMVKVIRRSDTSSIEDGTYSKFNICFEWSCYR